MMFTHSPSLRSQLVRPSLGACLALAAALPAASAPRQISTEGQRVLNDPRPTLAADLDGDGRAELLESFGTASAFRLEASGALVKVRDLRDPSVSFGDLVDVSVGDIDGNGLNDLAAIELLENSPVEAGIALYLNQGGTYLEAPIEFGALSVEDSLLLDDFDGDGDLDLVIYPFRRQFLPSPLPQDPWIRVYRNQGGQLTGAYLPEGFPTALSAAVPVDLDADGDLDFVAVDQTTEELVILRNQSGALTKETVAMSRSGYLDLEVGDVNGDGFLDVVALRRDSLFAPPADIDLFSGQAAGTLGAPLQLVGNLAQAANDVMLADGDGDGDLDIVTVTSAAGQVFQRIGILEGDGQGGFAPPAFQSHGAGAPRSRTLVGDFDADGDADLLTEVGLQSNSLPLAVNLRFGGSGQLGDLYADASTLGLVDPRAVNFFGADLNGNGLRDVIASSPALLAVALGQFSASEPALSAPVLYPLPPSRSVLLAANYDGDREDELVVQDLSSPGDDWTLIDGAGALGAINLIPLVGSGQLSPGTARAVDVDSDGDLDLVAEVFPSRELVWMENAGNQLFLTPVSLGISIVGQIRSHEFGDFNGDGTVDVLSKLLLIPSFTDRFEWREGLGGGAFGPLQPVDDGGNSSLIVDLNGDGADDLVWADALTGVASWTAGGPQGLIPGASAVLLNGPVDRSLLGLADLDGDGLRDLIFAEGGETVGFRRLAGPVSFDGTFVPLTPEILGSDAAAKLIDVGSDGDFDILVGSSSSTLFLYENESLGSVGDGYCGPALPNSTGAPSRIFATGTDEAATNKLTLRADGLPRNAFGFFIVSQTQVPATPVIASSGQICLGGMVGRYVGPGQVQQSGAAGAFALDIDLNAIPTPGGFVAGQPGGTWSFQAWHRDSDGAGGTTSNFTNGLQVDLR